MYTFGLGVLPVGVHAASAPLHWQEPSRLSPAKKGLDGICINSDVCTNFIEQFPKCLKTKQNGITEPTKPSHLQTVI